VVSFTPRPLYLRGKSPRYSLVRRLRGLRGDEEKISCSYRKSNPGIPTHSLVTVLVQTDTYVKEMHKGLVVFFTDSVKVCGSIFVHYTNHVVNIVHA
jgi:hypothetical protein